MEARVQADRQSTGTRDTLLVIDQESGLPIEGAYILTGERLLVSSPRGMIVFGHGTCFMDTVLVQCLGYGSRRVPLNEVFKESSIHTVCLSPDIQKLGEVVVTGERAGASPNVVSRRLSSPEIRNALGTSLATLLERVSGVSSISTGTAVSKPVIQGMYGNRILIIHNGARQTGQQWGADHAPEVDMNGSSSVSVIKGSDAVRYGSDALGGIIVMEQSPEPDKSLMKQSSGIDVELVVSSGIQMVDIPDLYNKEYRDATAALEELGFVVEHTYAASEVTKNYVIGTNPAAGEQLAVGGTVQLIISGGPELVLMEVPDLLNLTQSQAIDALYQAGLTLGSVTSGYSDTYGYGRVMWQSAEAGSEVAEGTLIYLVISQGPAPQPSQPEEEEAPPASVEG